MVSLGNWLEDIQQEEIQNAIELAIIHNPWFTPEGIADALNSIRTQFLDEEILTKWATTHVLRDGGIRVGLVLAGNIPLVGWHDVMCVYLSGHQAVLKPSEKDKVLLTLLINKLIAITPDASAYFEFTERIKDIDAMIATGSNNASRYFESYFGKYPNIIRKNRNSVAIIHPEDGVEVLKGIGVDIFTYFGLGCRNVSKIYLPKGYDITTLLAQYDDYKELSNHVKYRNNFDYTLSLYLLNRLTFLHNECLVVKEDTNLASRIACLHYEYYTDITTVIDQLATVQDQIQCIVSAKPLEGLTVIAPGQTQSPSIDDYADGVDTLAFLSNLSI